MPPFNCRGDNYDLEDQGDFIATYTAWGQGVVNLEYTPAELAQPVKRGDIGADQYLYLIQGMGCHYCISEDSCWKCMHGVSSLEMGRLSLTYRFVKC